MIIAIDPGWANIGICVGDEKEIFHTDKIKTNPKHKDEDRLQVIIAKLTDILIKYECSTLIFEEAYFSRKTHALKTYYMIGTLQCLFMTHGVGQKNIYSISPCSLKKFATGNYRADKAEMIRAINKETQGSYNNDHIVDAIALYLYYILSIKSNIHKLNGNHS
jgi:Holliday junction resolvasome RuvABC endonuclease subunit